MIRVEFEDDYIYPYDNNNRVGSLTIHTDDNELKWLDGIDVVQSYRRRGVATKLIKKAIREFKKIYVSTANKTQQEDNGDNTARYLSEEGAALINKLVERKLIKKSWMKNPFGEIDEY